jgi:nucleoside-diphosphate-sugar epimerase
VYLPFSAPRNISRYNPQLEDAKQTHKIQTRDTNGRFDRREDDVILVTGATGMLGRFVVLELQHRAQPVRVLARASSADHARALGVEVVIGDLGDADSLRQAMRDVDGIVHAACTFRDPKTDINAMQILLESWNRGPFVFISSVDVYGYPQTTPINEHHPLNPFSSYGNGKLECERLLEQKALQAKRTDWSILRAPNIWGPDRRSLEHVFSPVTALVKRIRDGKPVILPGTADTPFGDAWVDARELAWAAAECLTKPLSGAANAINEHFFWNEFCQVLIALMHSSSVIEFRDLEQITNDELPSKHFFAQRWRYAGKKLEQHLGFQPRHVWQKTLAAILGVSQS